MPVAFALYTAIGTDETKVTTTNIWLETVSMNTSLIYKKKIITMLTEINSLNYLRADWTTNMTLRDVAF